MATLFDAMLATARLVEKVRTGLTTAAGSTTTLVDANTLEPVDFWNNGLIFFEEGTLIGKTAQVIDYDYTTHTFTFAAQSAAPGSGKSYSVCESKYGRSELAKAVQDALYDIGPVTHEDATLVVVADQEEYDLPAGVSNVVKVEIATADAEPYNWRTDYWWTETEDGHLRFNSDYLPDEEGYKIRISYNAKHANVTADSSAISSGIKIELLRWMAAVNLYRAKYEETGKNDPALLELFNEAKTEARLAMLDHAPKRLSKTFQLGSW